MGKGRHKLPAQLRRVRVTLFVAPATYEYLQRHAKQADCSPGHVVDALVSSQADKSVVIQRVIPFTTAQHFFTDCGTASESLDEPQSQAAEPSADTVPQ